MQRRAEEEVGVAFLGFRSELDSSEVQAHCSVNCLDSPCLEGQCLHSHGVDSPTSARALKARVRVRESELIVFGRLCLGMASQLVSKVARTKSLLRSGAGGAASGSKRACDSVIRLCVGM